MAYEVDILSVLDNGGDTIDRYTISFLIFDMDTGELIESFMYGSSENPFHPMGFGQYVGDGCFPNTEENPEIGMPVEIDDLPKPVQTLINEILNN